MNSAVLQQDIHESAWDTMLEGAQLIEEDSFGPKVYALAGDRMLKLFRVKRFWSSHLWSPYARRFVRNAEQLTRLGFETVVCTQWGRIPHLERGYVLYDKLIGTPLRALPDLDPVALGRYFAQLHDQGVYFRSCHLGNLLLLDTGKLGLIDVMDMRFLPEGLSASERERNFRHLRRVACDRERLDPIWDAFMAAYEKG